MSDIKTMNIFNVDYIEKKGVNDNCNGCAFNGENNIELCDEALKKSTAIFGGGCADRNVGYEVAK